jgi:hypothetical protein
MSLRRFVFFVLTWAFFGALVGVACFLVVISELDRDARPAAAILSVVHRVHRLRVHGPPPGHHLTQLVRDLVGGPTAVFVRTQGRCGNDAVDATGRNPS